MGLVSAVTNGVLVLGAYCRHANAILIWIVLTVADMIWIMIATVCLVSYILERGVYLGFPVIVTVIVLLQCLSCSFG